MHQQQRGTINPPSLQAAVTHLLRYDPLQNGTKCKQGLQRDAMRFQFLKLSAATVTAGAVLCAQHAIDWQRQFEQGASHDEQTVERSRENAEAIADRVCREPPADLEKHVKEVAPYLQNRSPEVQLQASGFYMLLSMCRTDAGAGFASVRDVLAKAALNHLMAERSRANCLSALARIEPISSSEVFEVFQSTFNESVDRGYGRLIEPPAVGLARLAESNADSIRILHEYLQHPKGPDFRDQVVTAIGQAQSHDRTLTEDLGTY